MLFREVMPQIFFSVFLTVMIGGAFIMMYRNLRSQERLMKSKNEFIGNISHELKTPVATVSVALEALKNFHAIDNPQLTREYLDIATAELDRLSLMTDKILKTAVFEDKGVEYEPEAVDLRRHVEQVLASMKLVFEKNRADIEFNAVGNDFVLYGSATHLTNVIYNLLDNALKYSKTSPSIKILLNAYPSEIKLSVKDNGIGIEPVYQKKVFEKFFRVPTGDVHDIKGYGLGLNYVASVVRRHKGTVVLISEAGAGSEFILSLPRTPE
jgi:signal transduction histidine kinase